MSASNTSRRIISRTVSLSVRVTPTSTKHGKLHSTTRACSVLCEKHILIASCHIGTGKWQHKGLAAFSHHHTETRTAWTSHTLTEPSLAASLLLSSKTACTTSGRGSCRFNRQVEHFYAYALAVSCLVPSEIEMRSCPAIMTGWTKAVQTRIFG